MNLKLKIFMAFAFILVTIYLCLLTSFAIFSYNLVKAESTSLIAHEEDPIRIYMESKYTHFLEEPTTMFFTSN